jgi:hypothetical protein
MPPHIYDRLQGYVCQRQICKDLRQVTKLSLTKWKSCTSAISRSQLGLGDFTIPQKAEFFHNVITHFCTW